MPGKLWKFRTDYHNFGGQFLLVFVLVFISNIGQVYFAATDDNASQLMVPGSHTNHLIVDTFSVISRLIFGTRHYWENESSKSVWWLACRQRRSTTARIDSQMINFGKLCNLMMKLRTKNFAGMSLNGIWKRTNMTGLHDYRCIYFRHISDKFGWNCLISLASNISLNVNHWCLCLQAAVTKTNWPLDIVI